MRSVVRPLNLAAQRLGVRCRQQRWCSASTPAAATDTSEVSLEAEIGKLRQRLSRLERRQERQHTINTDLEYFARREVSALDFSRLLQFHDCSAEQLIAFARFVKDEVLIRLAKTRRAMDELPYGLSHMESIRMVMLWYEESFLNMRGTKTPTTLSDVDALLPSLARILSRHAATLQTVARGVFELKYSMATAAEASGWSEYGSATPVSVAEVLMRRFPLLQQSLDRFYTRRTGVRFLIAHLLDLCYGTSVRLGHDFPLPSSQESDLFYGKRPGTPGYYYGYGPEAFVGIICKQLYVEDVVKIAMDSVIDQARMVLGGCPAINIHVRSTHKIVHIPHALYTMVSELLKNAVRAVCEEHAIVAKHGDAMPPVGVDICVTEAGELTIRVSDEGGGIPRSKINKVMGYLYTTAPEPLYCTVDSTRAQAAESLVGDSPGGVGSLPFSGYGYGLPIVRQLSEYYQGTFDLASQEGIGTDCYIHLPPLQKCRERLSQWRG